MGSPAKGTTLAALQALTGREWASLGLTEEAAQSLLASFETAANQGGREAMQAVAREVRADMQAEQGKGEGEGSSEGEGQAEAEAQGEGEESEPKPKPEPDVSPVKQESSLDDHIVALVKRRRAEVLEGIDLSGGPGKRIRVKIPALPEVTFEHAHQMLPALIRVAALRKPVYIPGPAGGGKTTAGRQVAQAFGVPFYPNSNSPTDTYSKAFGYMDGSGTYRPGYLYPAMKTGGVLLDDEVDAGNPTVTISKNAAIENRFAYFPNGELVEAHADFIYIAAANTYGRGADRVYVGRNPIDGATLDRFINIDWDYDEELEHLLASDDEWTDYVQAVRKVVFDHKMRYVVSPRASINGGLLLSAGFTRKDVERMVLYKGWPQDDREKVRLAL
jgi:hypothetical protein